jgi:hypothetical protein
MHSSRTDQWGTPPCVLDKVHEVLGTIELDPASSDYWNAAVQAERYLTDALSAEPWSDKPVSVYLNPPGGKQGTKSLAGLFWTRLLQERAQGSVTHAIFMAFSAEALATTQKPGQLSIMDFSFCVPAKRLHFVNRGVKKTAPSHSNVIAYLPGTVDRRQMFRDVFSTLGKVVVQ